MWQQLFRPSIHSIIVVLSNAALIPPLKTLLETQHFFPAISLLFSGVASLFYHLCDEAVFCLLYPHLLHFTDVFLMFHSVIAVALMLIDIQSLRLKTAFHLFCTILAAVLLAYDRFSVAVNAILWACPVAAVVYRVLSGQMTRQWKRRELLVGLLWLLLGLVCFVMGNNYLKNGEEVYVTSPSAPETPVYWFMHSVWHFAAMLALTVLLRAGGVSKSAAVITKKRTD